MGTAMYNAVGDVCTVTVRVCMSSAMHDCGEGCQTYCLHPLNTLEVDTSSARFACGLYCSYPSLLAICNGDASSIQQYEGDFKSGPIISFLEKFSDGRKCNSSKFTCLDLVLAATIIWLWCMILSVANTQKCMFCNAV